MTTSPPALPDAAPRKTHWIPRRTVAAIAAAAVFLICLPVFLRFFLLVPYKIGSLAMSPTLIGTRKGLDANSVRTDHVFVNKLAYLRSGPRRGDIVCFKTGGIKRLAIENSRFVSRIAGLPGETIRIVPPDILADGRALKEPRIFKQISESGSGFSGYMLATDQSRGLLTNATDELILGPDEYFVVGDNTKSSYDSRYWGPVPGENVIGKVAWIYWPPQRTGRPE